MFGKSSLNHKEFKEPQLMKKKKLFFEQIRKQQRCQIISQLRQKANFPTDLTHYLNNLPENLNHLVQIIESSSQWPSSWHQILLSRLFVCLQTHLNIVFSQTQSPSMQIYVLLYIVNFGQVNSKQFDKYWTEVKLNSHNWDKKQKAKLLQLLPLAIKKIDIQYLKEAQNIIESCSPKIDQNVLDFYNFVVKNYPKEGFKFKILNDQLFKNIIKSLGLYFYSTNQKQKMCQILIQALYQSEVQTVSFDWDLISLFDALQMIMTYSHDNKMLIQRTLLLIYNINIDASSKIFLIHPCVQTLYLEIQNQDIPLQLRELMAQVYLSAIFNLPPKDIPKYMKNHFRIFSYAFAMILEEFKENQYLMKEASSLLKLILEIQKTNDKFMFKSLMIQNHELMESINRSIFGQEIFLDQNLSQK